MARFEWTKEAQQAFEALKKALIEATSLAFPLPQEPCILDTDASDTDAPWCCSVAKDRWRGTTHRVLFQGHEFHAAELLYDAP